MGCCDHFLTRCFNQLNFNLRFLNHSWRSFSRLLIQYTWVAVAIWAFWTRLVTTVTTWHCILLFVLNISVLLLLTVLATWWTLVFTRFLTLLFTAFWTVLTLLFTALRTLFMTVLALWFIAFRTLFITILALLILTRDLHNFFMNLVVMLRILLTWLFVLIRALFVVACATFFFLYMLIFTVFRFCMNRCRAHVDIIAWRDRCRSRRTNLTKLTTAHSTAIHHLLNGSSSIICRTWLIDSHSLFLYKQVF